MSSFTATIGLEVHAELNTVSKMFCGCANSPHDSAPNANVCPICLAHPGTLPLPNAAAIESVLLFGTAVGGETATYSEFDRKNYFYPDIPKAYQISQYQFPFVTGGELHGVTLTRVHLEEDTARSQHDKGEYSLVDFNRAGVPLMELVTEPVIHDATTAGEFARELQLLLRTLGVSNANMERGELRIEANISVSKTDTLGTKTEVKNLNSFRSVTQAIDFEIARHSELLERGGEVQQETRGWDENKGVTYAQRKKESAHDYRYFPDPDIPKLVVPEVKVFTKSHLNEKLPILPAQKREILLSLGIAPDTIATILADERLTEPVFAFIDNGEKAEFLQKAVNYLITDVQPLLQADPTLSVPLEQFSSLVKELNKGTFTSRVAKDMLPALCKEGFDPITYAKEHGLLQSNSSDELLPMVAEIIAENPTVVADYEGGKENALQYLVGQGMKRTKGSANPEVLRELLQSEISK